MTDVIELTGPEAAPADGSKPDRLIVFLHGLGANGADLMALAPLLAQVFPTAHFIAPLQQVLHDSQGRQRRQRIAVGGQHAPGVGQARLVAHLTPDKRVGSAPFFGIRPLDLALQSIKEVVLERRNGQ